MTILYNKAKGIAMQKESGAVGTALRVGSGVAAASALAGGGYFLGNKRGAKRGATQMANVMATEFTAANREENKQLARAYFRKGLSYNPSIQKESGMDKNAVLEQIRDEAFADELDKVAAKLPNMKKVIDIAKGVGSGVMRLPGAAMTGAKDVVKEIGKSPALSLGTGLVLGSHMGKASEKRRAKYRLANPK